MIAMFKGASSFNQSIGTPLEGHQHGMTYFVEQLLSTDISADTSNTRINNLPLNAHKGLIHSSFSSNPLDL